MRNYFIISMITLLVAFNCTAPIVEHSKLTVEYLLPSAIYQQSIDKVVLITPVTQQSIGTGILIESSGLLLTNWHIVGENKLVWVAFNNPQAVTKEDYKPMDWKIAEVVKSDPSRDLALLKIDSLNTEPFKFGKADELRIGQEVYSISHPQGQIFSFTKGLISKLPNKIEMVYQIDSNNGQSNIITRAAIFLGLQDTAYSSIGHKIKANAIQLQFPKNKGSSGGPIIDARGRLIGINSTANRLGENLSFAIRIDEIIDFLNDEDIFEQNIEQTEN